MRQAHALAAVVMGWLLCTVGTAATRGVSVTIDAHSTSDAVTQYEYGMFIEPIGALIARTL